jgi:lipid A 3-O-deacylase
MKTQRLVASAAAAAALSFTANAQAMDLTPHGAFAVAGVAARGTDSLTVGAVWPWAWRMPAGGGELTAITEAYVSYWQARAAVGRHSFTQIGLVPLLRFRPDEGRSAWFGEAGIGVSTTDRLYNTPSKQFSTRFNFVDTLGAGRNFGAQRQHELGLRLVHMSNASIKRPNPGENFLQVRYAVMF